ncbi:hypothetical protein [Bosea sp. (in: a-proteobacteria)]|uniref:hypothetical protein n=1 Tax=Bosea sp. (in: a-proteobacteria) TaxID=1871050 RepID=UPI00121F6F26|nr:hypothetical protein [Bosea sp. (in: a-proteobacteria)]TAJ33690.1 MAG: hypothetical protein EPO59_04115 [Bosea sp. (in: a-proteobacteria)]
MVRAAALGAMLAASAFVTATAASAAGSCRPTRDGKDRIENPGICPSGYVLRGACCESIRAMAPSNGEQTCPAGSMLRLGVCVPRQ